jgi:hypothetical protein
MNLDDKREKALVYPSLWVFIKVPNEVLLEALIFVVPY